MPYTRPVSFFITLSPDLWHSCLPQITPSAAASWTSSTANRPSESTNRPSAAASRPSESAIPSTTTKPLHDDYQFRRHNDRKSSNMTNASSSRRRKRPSMMTGPIAAASRQSLRLPQAHLETSSRPPLSMAVRSPSRHPRGPPPQRSHAPHHDGLGHPLRPASHMNRVPRAAPTPLKHRQGTERNHHELHHQNRRPHVRPLRCVRRDRPAQRGRRHRRRGRSRNADRHRHVLRRGRTRAALRRRPKRGREVPRAVRRGRRRPT